MGWGVKRLNGMDAMLLYSETPNLHTHTLKVAIIHAADFDGEFTFDVFRRTIAAPAAPARPAALPTRSTSRGRLHHPMWMENCPVDLDYHLRRVRVPSLGGRRELDEVIGQIASTPLDRSRPLWEFHFAEGMADDRFALIGKVHHTLADGVASANLLARLMDPGRLSAGRARRLRHLRPAVQDGSCSGKRNCDHFQNMAALPRLISDAARGFARVRKRNKERPDHPDMARMFQGAADFSQSCGLAGPDIRDGHAVVGRGQGDRKASRRHVQRHRAGDGGGRSCGSCCCATTVVLIDRSLATVPVSTDRSAERITGNEISGITVSLAGAHRRPAATRVGTDGAVPPSAPRKTTICSVPSCRAG